MPGPGSEAPRPIAPDPVQLIAEQLGVDLGGRVASPTDLTCATAEIAIDMARTLGALPPFDETEGPGRSLLNLKRLADYAALLGEAPDHQQRTFVEYLGGLLRLALNSTNPSELGPEG